MELIVFCAQHLLLTFSCCSGIDPFYFLRMLLWQLILSTFLG